MSISHFKSDTIADFTGTVTVYDQLGSTQTVAATDLVRPSDWNSAHYINYALSGNTAGASTISGMDVTLVGGNNITLSADTALSQLVISAATALTSQSNQALSAANGSFTFQTATFANSNGVSFSTGTQGIFATVQTNYLTTARASNDAVGLNTALTAGPLAWTVNSNGISLNAGSAAGTTSGFAGNLISGSMTHNTAGLNLSLNHPAWLTTARASNDAVGLNTAQSNVTWTVNSAGLSLDARGYAGTGTTFGGTNISGSMTLNSNGIQLSLSGGGGGVTNQTGPNIAAGGVTVTDGTVVFSNSNMVSFGIAGSTLTASVGGGTATMWWPFNEGVNVAGQQGNATWNVAPILTPPTAVLGEVHVDRVCFPIILSNSSNSTGSATISMSIGLYTKNVSSLSLLHSTTGTLAVTYSGTVNNSTYAGIRLFTVPWTTTVGDGRYYVAVASRTTSGGANCTISQMLVSQLNSNFSGLFGVSNNRSNQWPLGFGVYSASSSGFPNPIPLSQLDGTGSLAARPPSWFMISGTV